ncbi:MAG: AMP-binding protein [Akkermansiaceae bacterium]
MERESFFDRALWLDRFEDDEGYCLSAENGVSPVVELGLTGNLMEVCGSCFLIKTSGSSGEAKWVVHSKKGLLRHASLVNDHLGVTVDDVFGVVLPVYHVGGLGVVARGLVSGAKVVIMGGKWSVKSFVGFLEQNRVSVVSLVPTQVVDIVSGGFRCPECVRVVVVGGGSLDPGVRVRARELGWPVSGSYGMTETGSQIATGQFVEEGYLDLIDGWEVRLADEGVLEVKGECLLEGYLVGGSGGFEMVDPKVDGWFRTSDRVELLEKDEGVGIRFLGRSDQQVKILGELVNVSALEIRLKEVIGGEVYVVGLADERRGVRLFPVVVDGLLVDRIRDLGWGGLERLEGAVVVGEFPRNEMGKLSRSKLVEVVESIVFSAD